MRKKISIVIPVYNEEPNVHRTYERVKAVMAGLADRYDHELVFTDNHSTDRTFEIIVELARNDACVRGIRFSRNFGYQRSILTGYLMSTGDAAVQLDCDLEDPPEMIPDFVAKWEQGYRVVYGVRSSRQEGKVTAATRRLFYRLIDALSEDDLPHDAGDFRLLDRRIVNELGRYYDCSPYIRGAVASMGFDQVGISYHRQRRQAGRSKFNFRASLHLAMDGILNHSTVPLRIASISGLVGFFASLVLAFVYLFGRLFFGASWPPGFATLTLLLLISISFNAMLLGILGEYIGRIFQQVKNRPNTIIEQTVNVDSPAPQPPQVEYRDRNHPVECS
ncbi:MAG: glycosyltransferase family 2 protein [Phycisphaerae bacterium]|nr:glycosyltransferase family 2 protein [Phycisphaerae bacterium]